MTHHHDLGHEFPELRSKIHELKTQNAHFRKLVEAYEELDRAIVRMEDNIEPSSDDIIEQKKQERVQLKDQLYAMLRA